MGPEGEAVHLLAPDVPAVGDLLGRQPLVDEVETVAHRRPVGVAGAGLGRRPDGDAAHGLDAPADGHLHGPGGHGLSREVDGLLGRSALTVHSGPGHGVGEAGGQRRVAADVHGLLPDRHGAAVDDVLDDGRVDAGALDEGGQGPGGEVDRVPTRQTPVAPTDGGPHDVDDHGRRHVSIVAEWARLPEI